MKSSKFEVEFFAGTTDHWGFEIAYFPYESAFSVTFIHWYFGISVWKRRDTAS